MFFEGCGWKPYFVEGDEPMKMHQKMADTLDTVTEEIQRHPASTPARPASTDPSELAR